MGCRGKKEGSSVYGLACWWQSSSVLAGVYSLILAIFVLLVLLVLLVLVGILGLGALSLFWVLGSDVPLHSSTAEIITTGEKNYKVTIREIVWWGWTHQ